MSPEKFKIIPVIDILDSTCVHAKKGERDKYKPLKNVLTNTTNPLEFIKNLKIKYGFSSFYAADLDSITRNTPNSELISQFISIPDTTIMVDLGIRDIEDFKSYLGLKIPRLIIGLETVKSLKTIQNALELAGSDKIIVSVDMYNEKIISPIKELQGKNPQNIIKSITETGIEKIILLDLFKVGQKTGNFSSTYEKIREIFEGDIFIGGGIKNLEEIIRLRDKQFSGVLIATALYDGTIKVNQLKKNGLI